MDDLLRTILDNYNGRIELGDLIIYNKYISTKSNINLSVKIDKKDNYKKIDKEIVGDFFCYSRSFLEKELKDVEKPCLKINVDDVPEQTFFLEYDKNYVHVFCSLYDKITTRYTSFDFLKLKNTLESKKMLNHENNISDPYARDENDIPAYAKSFKGAGNQTYKPEQDLLKMLEKFKKEHDLDPRWTSIAKTHFEQGFMAWRKSFQKD